MTTLWQRFLRLWREPRIRLSAPGLRAEDLRPGDRLQIGSRLWQVETRSDAARPDVDSDAAFELTAAEGPTDQIWLRVAAGRWTLASESGDPRAIELDPAGMIHYPVSRAATPGRRSPTIEAGV